MHSSLENLTLIKNKVNEIIKQKQLKTDPKVIVVTKTFSLDKITPLIENGHLHFGENKIQEAEIKWSKVKDVNKKINLHMIGKLQSNKAKKAIKIFDYIHSLDNAKLASKINPTGGPVTSTASVNLSVAGNGFGVGICDIEIDPQTGKTDVVNYTAIQDVGKAIYPAYVEGQIKGGAVQGIGWALNEEYYIENDGSMANTSFLDYRMPTALDMPNIDVILVEVPNPLHPFGVRGVGEVPIVPPLAAVGNAIKDATGERLFETPMNPRKILEVL